MIIQEPYAPGITRCWTVSQVLAHKHTGFQDVLIGKTEQGITLFCDDERQSSELSQQIYHDAQVVPALCVIRKPLREIKALVIGSSEGVVSLMLEKADVPHIDHVDIDAACVRLCAKLLPYGYTAMQLGEFEQERGLFKRPIEVTYADGQDWLRNCINGKYDLIVSDLPDVDTAHATDSLYGSRFMHLVASKLTQAGVFITQAGCSTYWRNAGLQTVARSVAAAFPHIGCYDSDEHDWCWMLASHEQAVFDLEILAQLHTRGIGLSIDAEALQKGSILPKSIRKAFDEAH